MTDSITSTPQAYKKGTKLEWSDSTVKELVEAFNAGHTTGTKIKKHLGWNAPTPRVNSKIQTLIRKNMLKRSPGR